MWLVVRLEGRDAPRSPAAKRIVVREIRQSRFAIEVDEVFGVAVLDNVASTPFPAWGWRAPAGWLKRGVAHDGRTICCVDVDSVATRLAAHG
ncbi:MAG: hypothetical protein HY300_05315 [Verrucomicrobia bacterium]|nr:hypothetical protein [Verrucomicrobiota bacterium]